MAVKKHKLIHPMLYGWQTSDTPSDNKSNIRYLSERLKQDVYDPYRQIDWFKTIEVDTAKLL